MENDCISGLNKTLSGPYTVEFETSQAAENASVMLNVIFNPVPDYNVKKVFDSIIAIESLLAKRNSLSDKIIIEKKQNKLHLKISDHTGKYFFNIIGLSYNESNFNTFTKLKQKIHKYWLKAGLRMDKYPIVMPGAPLEFSSCTILNSHEKDL
jgi:hypothetical protein